MSNTQINTAEAVASSLGAVSPRTAVVRVLVNALADTSLNVREAAAAALRDNAKRDAAIILECCSASLNVGGKKKGGPLGSHHAAALRTMAYAVTQMEVVDEPLMLSYTKVALGQMTTPKELNSDWQLAASSLLVAIACRMPDMVVTEVFQQMAVSGPGVPPSAIIRMLAEFAEADVEDFVPRLKEVLSKVVPVLGGIRDVQRKTFADAFAIMGRALTFYNANCYANCWPPSRLDSDSRALINSAYDLFLGTWLQARDPAVRSATAEALGQLASYIGRPQLKSMLPKLLPALLALYKKDASHLLPATSSIHMVLDTALVPETGRSLIDFQALTVLLNTILPMASITPTDTSSVTLSTYMKINAEVLRCFDTIGATYPDEMCSFLLNRVGAKPNSREEASRQGTFTVLKHLITRLKAHWEVKRHAIAEAVKPALQEQDLNLRKAIAQVVVAMGSSSYLEKENGEAYVEFLIRQCAIPDAEVARFEAEHPAPSAPGTRVGELGKADLKVGPVSPKELRAICSKGLHLLASTAPEMERVLWPLLMKMLRPEQYTGAVSVVCNCLSELARKRLARGEFVLVDFTVDREVPRPQVLLARLLVLLQNPNGREHLGLRILNVLLLLAPFFNKEFVDCWQDVVPEMIAFLSSEDHHEEWQSSTWEQMVLNLLSVSLDASKDMSEWIVGLGSAFADQYELYVKDNEHSALLHRCLGLVLQKVEDANYVRDKVDLMYKRAEVSDELNRHGLAMGMGLVASAHLNIVLDKLRQVVEIYGRKPSWLSSLFSDTTKGPSAEDVCAAVALMYGYAATYAPSTAIEARIDTLVGTNTLTGLLTVTTPAARQAVITAIDLLGKAVIKAAKNEAPFQLKRRDVLLEHVMMLMVGKSTDVGQVPSSPDVLKTQIAALSAYTTLVSVEPKLPPMMRDRVLSVTLGFITLPNNHHNLVTPLVDNLTTLMCAMIQTGAEDGKSRADLLQLLLRQLDKYIDSPVELQRQRACFAALALMRQFQSLAISSNVCPLKCPRLCSHVQLFLPSLVSPRPRRSNSLTPTSSPGHSSQVSLTSPSPSRASLKSPHQRSQSSAGGVRLLPTREALKLGERTMTYLPRITDTSPNIRWASIQVLEVLFDVALQLPKPVGTPVMDDDGTTTPPLAGLEGLAATTKEAESQESIMEVLGKTVEIMSALLTTEELVTGLRMCQKAICDKTREAGQGAIVGVTKLISARGSELRDSDVPRVTQSLLNAAAAVDKSLRGDVVSAVCALAEHSKPRAVFNELLLAVERDTSVLSSKKDSYKKKEMWPIEEALQMLARRKGLGLPLLDYVLEVLSRAPIYADDNLDPGSPNTSDPNHHPGKLNAVPQAATLALGSMFRAGGEVGRQVVEPRYAAVMSALLLRMGSVHGTAKLDMQPARDFVNTFHSFCDCIEDLDMREQMLSTDDEQRKGNEWIEAASNIASRARPDQVAPICDLLWPCLKRAFPFQRIAVAAALSEYVQHSGGDEKLMGQLVGALSAHIGDEAADVRRLCVRGLVHIPQAEMLKYASQVLSVVVALIEDHNEEVSFTAVHGLVTVLDMVSEETVAPMLLNLCVRLRSLQNRLSVSMRAAAFEALGRLSRFGSGLQRDAFLEQVHTTLPRLAFHANDEAPEVRQACKGALRRLAPLLEAEPISELLASRTFESDRRGKYDEFLHAFSMHLANQFADRTDMYMAATVQAFDSSWPCIQANAAYFGGCLLSQLHDARFITIYLPQVTVSLVRMTANSSSSLVRGKSASALSLLLCEMQPLT